MGVGCCKSNDIPEILVSHNELKVLVQLCQNKCKDERIKKIETINNNKSDIMKCIKGNDMKSANTKTDTLIKDENYIAVYDILDPIFELIKTKCNYIISTTECPDDLRNYLDSLLYAAIRLDIDELMTFKEKINKIYGSDYIEIAVNNKDKKVNNDLVEKLKITTFSEEVIKERQNQLKSENQNRSQRVNSPNRSILKKINNNINNNQGLSTNINSQSTIKGSTNNGYQSERDQSPINPTKNDLEIEGRNKKEKNVIFGKTILDTVQVPKTSDTSKQNQQSNNSNDNKISEGELKAVELFPTKTIKTILASENQSNQQPQDDNDDENINNSLFGKTKKTFYQKDNQSNEQPKENENKNNDLIRAETYKTLNLSIENPDNKENPFEGDPNDIFGSKEHNTIIPSGRTLGLEKEINIDKNINTQNNKDKNDEDILGKTLPIEEVIKNEGEGPDPFDPNAKVKNPFDGPTLDIEEVVENQKDVKILGENDKK